MKTAREITAALVELASATNKELDELVIGVYVKNLSAFDADQIVAAISRLILSAKFFPSVGEIVAAMGQTPELRAAEAWAGGKPRDKLMWVATEKTMKLIGGREYVSHYPTDKIHFLERRFCELYPDVEARLNARYPELLQITSPEQDQARLTDVH